MMGWGVVTHPLGPPAVVYGGLVIRVLLGIELPGRVGEALQGGGVLVGCSQGQGHGKEARKTECKQMRKEFCLNEK